MKITINNLASIQYGTIDLNKDLTVLIGKNSTAKNQVNCLLHALYRMARREQMVIDKYYTWKALYATLLKAVKEYDFLHKTTENEMVVYDITQTLVQEYDWLLDTFSKDLARINSLMFAGSFKKASYKIENDLPPQSDKSIVKVGQDAEGYYWMSKDGNRKTISLKADEELAKYAIRIIAVYVLKSLPLQAVFYLPSERFVLNGLGETAKKLYPTQPISLLDYGHFIGKLASYAKETSPFAALATAIEHKIFQGKLLVGDQQDIQFLADKTENSVSLFVAPNIVKSLAGLVFYLKCQAQKGDVLILDNPELLLAPGQQKTLARLLAHLVNEGFKIILSTESDFFIKELNLLLLLNKVKENAALLKEVGYTTSNVLTPAKMGVYQCTTNTIQKVEVTEKGFVALDLDEAINQQDETLERLWEQVAAIN